MKIPFQPPKTVISSSSPQEEESFDEIVLEIKESSLTKKSKKQIKTVGDLLMFLDDWVVQQSTVSLQDKLLFFQLLGATTHAGISLTDALVMIQEQVKNKKLQRTIMNLHDLIQDGESLAGAMRRNDNIFDLTACAIVEAGEKSGKLNMVLTELVTQYEQIDRIQKKVKGVMTYPIVVICAIILLTAVVLIFVVPRLLKIFGSASELPFATRVLKDGSDLMIQQWPTLLVIFLILVTSFVLWKRSPMGRIQWAWFLLSLPLVSPILKGLIISRFTRVFGFLIASGVPMVEGLRLAASTTNNPLYEEKLLLASDDLTKGISIAENISDNEKLFPKMLVNMIAIGEKSASLESVMGKIANYYNEELNRRIETLSRIMEPIILIFIAGAAIFFIMAVYMPILQMNDQVLKKSKM